MLIEQAAILIEKILNDKPKLSNWELDFIATISRIASSGKIEQLSASQSSSLIKIFFRNIIMPKVNNVIDESELKCQSCHHGYIHDEAGGVRCPHCDGHGYLKPKK
jgi:Zn finger protein HypA/HybF involved in hydrogenase expression